ncbi:N,N-dimethylformamidase beta subunit family domain-containing protein [Sinosporangium siamense]|uniref:Large subunit of N,N-dimethylformamidase n=1 Tax=Sinosporangium siamense TaxID=1367973 RepID=A0A919VAG0_9ACTN|nr:N,N-dimethylformamidase beta subunit family domain-containing protein [Sinosporangium siamense]GII96436.1 large subunit of N,N-dimethylformamidase [Sinosporangium siamense]
MKLFSYLDRLSARPGDTLAVMASGDGGDVVVDLVRLVHGDTDPAGPGLVTEVVGSVAEQRVRVDAQETWPGSCMVADRVIPAGVADVMAEVLVWPTTPELGRVQGVLGLVGEDGAPVVSIVLDGHGRPAVLDGDGAVLAVVERALRERRWYRVSAVAGTEGVVVRAAPLEPFPGDDGEVTAESEAGVDLSPAAGVVAAAVSCPTVGVRRRPGNVFNGKLERPTLRAGGEVLAEWMFDRGFDGDRVADVSGRCGDATLVNMPARAMTGHNWTGETSDFTVAPEQYGAVHFHDDDLIDAGWPVAATVTLPPDLRSGIYAVRLRDGEETDHVPVVVRPAPAVRKAPIVFLVPTFTYTAYANERLLHRLDYEAAGLTDHPITPWEHDRALAEHPEFGGSLYDHHSDGSGICYSSALRPIPNLRPDYRMWLQNAPRHLGADLYLVYWLEQQGFDFDVLSDHDLHADGDAALEGYRVVVTGSHPEYHSERMLDALRGHTTGGGSMAYLGGNGFYWVTSQDPARPHVLEVRRSAGIRTWEARPGEQRHSTTGEQGGLWRWRGRSPNALTGVGMCSQGWDEKAPPFERTPLSYEPEWAWVFEGIDDHLIGDFGFIMNGASGDELDRCDFALGSPPNTAVLATSRRHSDFYQLAVEDVLMLGPGLGGSECEDVRSDMVVVEQVGGGAVFSVGSVCFTGSLTWNGSDNNVSRLVRNVLTNFAARDTKRV